MLSNLAPELEELLIDPAAVSEHEQDAMLTRLCADDTSIRAQVESALRNGATAADAWPGREPTVAALRKALGLPSLPSGKAAEDPVVGTSIGPYRIVRLISEGGMGVVYEAEQQRPQRRVALKVIRPGHMSAAALRRFEYETDVLARLEHSGIARVYEAGIANTANGQQPFFAMEYVDGYQLSYYIAQTNPPLNKRLELLIRICDAVQHAHTKGIIHRDLKPANILITRDGTPKVLDFGVARMTDADIHATTLHTESGVLVGTLPYMAPEQASGKVRELDTSSDVYALGVVAFELLSGRMPYSLKGIPLHDAVRVICEDEPSRLSSLDRSLGGDVETIVQKALEKEQARRYATAGELAADVKRYLDYEPITARPPSPWYSIRRFAGRNKVVVTAAALVFVALTGATAISVRSALTANRQRREAELQRTEAQQQTAIAEAVSRFQSDMLASADPNKMLGEGVTVLQAAEGALKELDAGRLNDQPLVEAAVRDTIGNTFRELGRSDQAAVNLERALELRRKYLPPKSRPLSLTVTALGVLRKEQGRLNEAESLFREALEIDRATLPAGHQMIATSMHNLASLLHAEQRLDEAAATYQEALEMRRREVPPDLGEIAATMHNLAGVLRQKGKTDESIAMLRESLDLFRRSRPAGHIEIATALNSLGGAIMETGNFAEAEPLLRESLELRRKVLSPDHPSIAYSLSALAQLFAARGNYDEAESASREALTIYRKRLPAMHPDVAWSLRELGTLLADRGKVDEAEPMFREALEIRRKLLPAGHPLIAKSVSDLAGIVREQGHPEKAQRLYLEALETMRRAGPVEQEALTDTLGCYAALLQDLDRYDQAEPLLREALGIDRRRFPAGHPKIADSVFPLACVLEHRGKFDESEQLFREAIAIRAAAVPPGNMPRVLGVARFASFLRYRGRLAEAERLLRDELEVYRKDMSPGHPIAAAYMDDIAELARDQGHLDEAEHLCREALAIRLAKFGPKGKLTLTSATSLAALLEQTDRHADAESLREEYGLSSPATAAETPPAVAARPLE